MRDSKNEISTKWRVIVLLCVIFLIALITQDVIREIIVFQQETNMISDELNRNVRNEVKDYVYNAKDEFYSVINNLNDLLLEHSRNNIAGLIFGASIVVDINEGQPTSEITNDIIQMTQNYDLLDDDHQYYVFDIYGVELFDGSADEVVNFDRLNEKDDLNREYIKEFVTNVIEDEENEGFVSFYYFDELENLIHYMMYGERVEGTDLILANIVNMDTFSEKMKGQEIEKIFNMYLEEERKIYILSNDGDVLYHKDSTMIGLNYMDIEDELWKSRITDILDYTNEHPEGYMEYEFYGVNEEDLGDDEVESKLAYVYKVDDWDIIIGASKDLDSYDDIIDAYVAENYRLVLLVKVPAYFIIFSLAISIFIYLRMNVKDSLALLEEEEQLYRKFADLTSEIILMTDKHGEIIFTNRLGRRTIFGSREDTKNVFFDQIFVEEDGYYILYGYTEHFFVKFVTEEITYNNMNTDLFIITDVSEKIRTERRLEALSLNDDLTSLGNRRLMVKEYNDIMLPAIKIGKSAFIAMIDLDDFKPANDIYGHSYGDQVLKNVSDVFIKHSDDKTMVYRIGGDEFAILFLEYTKDQVDKYLTNLQTEVSQFEYEKKVKIGFSAGVSKIEISSNQRRFSDFYDKADKLLYKSKNEGKNRINF